MWLKKKTAEKRPEKMNNMEKLRVKEVIVVEGRDDTNAVLRAIDGLTIETHGFGIKAETWSLLEKAYEEKGLIIFTDPDYSGEEIRRKLTARFPDSRQAFLTRSEAERKGDIGIENASPEDIAEAIRKAHFTAASGDAIFTEDDLFAAGLTGRSDAAQRRQKLGCRLGIGYGNAKGFLKKLNQFGVSREDFEESVKMLEDEE